MGMGTAALVALRRAAWRCTLLIGGLALASGAAASTSPAKPSSEKFDVRHFTCPLGGKPFDQDVGYFAFPLITLPDGSWLGDNVIDAQIPVCPDNGLVLLPDYVASTAQGQYRIAFHVYTPAELARLPALIADPAYAAHKAEGRHAAAWWLATQLGRPAFDRYALLQRATWAATPAPLRHQLVERLAAEGPALIDAADVPEGRRRVMRYDIVNALRELGRFDEALALLEKVERAGTPVAAPVDPDSMFGPPALAPDMRRAIAERDDGRFPIELLTARMVSDICNDTLSRIYGPRTPGNVAACKTRRDREARENAASEAAMNEQLALEENPEELARRCTATPPAGRSAGLARACETLQDHRDEVAAVDLVKDGAKLADACESMPERDWKGPLRAGCISYTVALESALGTAIAADDAAWKILCPGGGDAFIEDRDSHLSLACSSAERERAEREGARMLADPSGLGAQCNVTPRTKLPLPVFQACLERDSQRERQRDTARIDRRNARVEGLAGDPAAFTRECGRFPHKAAAPRTAPTGADALMLDIENPIATGDNDRDICENAYNLRENRAVEAAGKAKGLVCEGWLPYGAERPVCRTPADIAADQPRGLNPFGPVAPDDDRFDESSSLSIAARAHAAAIIARAKAEGTYPKRKPGDRL